MKIQFGKSIGKRAFTIFSAFVILFCSSAKTYAFADSTSAKFSAVTYEGLKDNSLLFKVDYKNESAQAFQLVIKGEQNEILYSRSFDARPLATSILLTEFPENCKLTFQFQTTEKNLTQSFQIVTKVKTVEEYVVKGL